MAYVVVTGVMFSAGGFVVLMMALSRAQQLAPISEPRLRARYAAEAAIVYAQGMLWASEGQYPSPCCGGGCAGQNKTEADWPFDSDGNGAPDVKVNITVTNCGSNRDHKIIAATTWNNN